MIAVDSQILVQTDRIEKKISALYPGYGGYVSGSIVVLMNLVHGLVHGGESLCCGVDAGPEPSAGLHAARDAAVGGGSDQRARRGSREVVRIGTNK